MFQLTFMYPPTPIPTHDPLCFLHQPLRGITSPLGFAQPLRNMPKEALFVHLSCPSLSSARSIQKHMLHEGSLQVSLEQFATSVLSHSSV